MGAGWQSPVLELLELAVGCSPAATLMVKVVRLVREAERTPEWLMESVLVIQTE